MLSNNRAVVKLYGGWADIKEEEFQEKYPDGLCEDKLDSILKQLRDN